MIVYYMQSITTAFSDQNTVITNIIILFQSRIKGSSLDWDYREPVYRSNSSMVQAANSRKYPQPPQPQFPLLYIRGTYTLLLCRVFGHHGVRSFCIYSIEAGYYFCCYSFYSIFTGILYYSYCYSFLPPGCWVLSKLKCRLVKVDCCLHLKDILEV